MNNMQPHTICFQNTENDWSNALFVGNGRLGAMVFYQDHTLHISMNHYDCYYRLLPRPKGAGCAEETDAKSKGAEAAQETDTRSKGADAIEETGEETGKTSSRVFQDPALFRETYDELCRKTELLRQKGETGRMHYARMLHPVGEIRRPSYQGARYPEGAELMLPIKKDLNPDSSCLKLIIEEARILFEAGDHRDFVRAEIIASREPDGILLTLFQTRSGLWSKRSWRHDVHTGAAVSASSFRKSPEGMTQTVALTLLPEDKDAPAVTRSILKQKNTLLCRHRAYWKDFWHSAVHLPDSFLEHLWYLQLYLLECSNARGSRYPEQSWGLSGLWDIRKPNMWGSMWYWDANIQSSFWGTCSAAHPELLKLFCDGYLSYEQDIRLYTREVYGRDGWALDYPHTLYHCIQPWCAQFLWLYYQYTGDLLFLEQKAYPVFRSQVNFFRFLARQDEQGIWHIPYDISPEQGPVTCDSVITISCIKKLLSMTLEAAQILKRPEEEISEAEDILSHLPPYPKTADQSRYKDSALAQDHLFLRHPSLLMPLFPAEETDCGVLTGTAEQEKTRFANRPPVKKDTSAEEYLLWKETLQYAATHTETGTFGMGWLSAAAARLGLGKDALMLLYERGLDHVLHDNGLAYEESPGFLNYCHLTKPAHYLPVMMEAAGGILNAVNLMLLQTSSEGEILVFPAVPGKNAVLTLRSIQYQEDLEEVKGEYEEWTDVSFDSLMAPGGFLISAVRKNSRTVFIMVKSTRDAFLRLSLPEELSPSGKRCRVEKAMQAGDTLRFGDPLLASPETGTQILSQANPGSQAQTSSPKAPVFLPQSPVLCHTAAITHRRIFLGADPDTRFRQAVDAFTCPLLFGNELCYPRTPCIFDFGASSQKQTACKDYDNTYPRQIILSGQCILYCAGPKPVGAEPYTPEKGYGFLDTEGICRKKRNAPDDLRADFLEGSRPAVFVLDLPRGKYDLLIVSGDEEEASGTRFSLKEQGTKADTGILPPGRYGCMHLPLIHARDGQMLLSISSSPGYHWKLNAIFVNKD